VSPSILKMSPRLKSVIALWFVLQIVLPFTAPLQTCGLGDLLPASHQSGALSHESSAMPLPVDARARSFLSPLEASALRASLSLVPAPRLLACGLRVSRPDASPLSAQQTVLRL
jgi:hypothetical protein